MIAENSPFWYHYTTGELFARAYFVGNSPPVAPSAKGYQTMAQRFIARESFQFPNGALGWRPGGPFDCLGPYAKVQNCPIAGTNLRLTCYATSYADTAFSVPACTRYRGQYIKGYFSESEDGIEFRVMNAHKARLGNALIQE